MMCAFMDKDLQKRRMIEYAHHYTQSPNPFAISLDGTDVADVVVQVIPKKIILSY